MQIKKAVHKRLWDFLGSRNLSVFIFVMGMVYYLILLVFSMLVPLPWVHKISKLLPYQFLYLLFFLNLFICEIKWIPVVVKRCSKLKRPERIEDLERFRDRIRIKVSEDCLRRIKKNLRKRWYNTEMFDFKSEKPDDCPQVSTLFYASKGRFSPLGNLLFHFSFFFLLLGIGISLLYRFDGVIVLAEGQGTLGDGSSYVSQVRTKRVSAEEPIFELSKISPEFWMERLLFTDLKAEVIIDGEKKVTRLSQPITIDGKRVSISGMAIAPEYLLKDSRGRELDNGYVTLNIFMPASEDWFVLPGTPYRIVVSFYPDFEQRGKRLSTRSMNPINPVFKIKVFREERNIYNGILKPGEEAHFDDARLSFPSFTYGGSFRVLYDGGFVFIWIGLILMLLGLIMRFLFYRKEVIVWKENSGEVFLGGSSEYFEKLFLSELGRLAGVKRA